MAKSKNSRQNQQSDDKMYTVEYIRRARKRPDATWEYHIKWAGYPNSDSTWEPAENLEEGCSSFLASFWEAIGMGDDAKDDWPIKSKLKPPAAWITTEKERQTFVEENPQAVKEERMRLEMKNKKDKPIGPGQSRKIVKKKKPTFYDEDEDDDTYEDEGNGGEDDDSEDNDSQGDHTEEVVSEKAVSEKAVSEEDPSEEEDDDDDDDDDAPLSRRQARHPGRKMATRKPSLRISIPDTAPKSASLSPSVPLAYSRQGQATTPKKPYHPKRIRSPSLEVDPPPSKHPRVEAPPRVVASASTLPPPQPRPVQTHKERTTHPLVQPMDVRYTDTASPIGVKRRIMHEPMALKQPEAAPRNKYAGLSMRRKSLATTDPSSLYPPATAQNVSMTAGPVHASPVQMNTDLPEINGDDLFGDDLYDIHSDNEPSRTETNPAGNTTPAAQTVPPARLSLSPVVLPTLSPVTLPMSSPSIGPLDTRLTLPPPVSSDPKQAVDDAQILSFLEECVRDEPQPIRAPTVFTKVPLRDIPIPRKWRFDGDLYLTVSANKADRLCGIFISEESEQKANPPPHMKYFFGDSQDGSTSLRLDSLFPTEMAEILFPAFGANQFAKISPLDTSDEPLLRAFANYLQHMSMMATAQIPFNPTGSSSLSLLIFHPSAQKICQQLAVPIHLRQISSGLIIALLFRRYQPKYPKYTLPKIVDIRIDAPAMSMVEHSIRKYPKIHRGIQSLRFPDSLGLQMRKKPYCIYDKPVPASETSATPIDHSEPDTVALSSILRGHEAIEKHPSSRTPTIHFIHNRAWGQLGQLAGFSARLRQGNMHFFAYGPYHRLEPKFYGIREVLPCGGVVTFTARAIAENPSEVESLIAKLHKHPFWMCYILPSVIGCLDHITALNPAPSSPLKDKVTAMSAVLIPIQLRYISLTTVPPANYKTEELAEWIGKQDEVGELDDSSEILEYCKEVLTKRYFPSNTPVTRKRSPSPKPIQPSTGPAAGGWDSIATVGWGNTAATTGWGDATDERPRHATIEWGLPISDTSPAAVGGWSSSASGWGTNASGWGESAGDKNASGTTTTTKDPRRQPGTEIGSRPIPTGPRSQQAKRRPEKRLTDAELERKLDEEVWHDLAGMQHIPALHEKYRHFILICSPTADRTKWTDDGVERMTLQQFVSTNEAIEPYFSS